MYRFVKTKIGVIGGGSWGTALCVALGRKKTNEMWLWVREKDVLHDLQTKHENRQYLPGKKVYGVEVTDDIGKVVENSDLLIVAVPVEYFRLILEKIAPWVPEGRIVVSVSKGIEVERFVRPSELIQEMLPHSCAVVLSGPSHAEEVADSLPTSVVCASKEVAAMERVQRVCSTDRYRIYTNGDVVGVELGGALKNVIAIAAGIVKGMGYGINTTAALVSRGAIEICRFGVSQGATERTFFGLSGVGDLIATCTSSFSRNYYVGCELGKGRLLQEILGSMKMVAEGIGTVKAVHKYSLKHQVEMPITEAVYQVAFEGRNPMKTMEHLMNRKLKQEFD